MIARQFLAVKWPVMSSGLYLLQGRNLGTREQFSCERYMITCFYPSRSHFHQEFQTKVWVEARSAASSWEDIENLGNFKRPSLLESTPTGTQMIQSLKTRIPGQPSLSSISRLGLGLSHLCHWSKYVHLFVVFFNPHSSLMDRMNDGALEFLHGLGR